VWRSRGGGQSQGPSSTFLPALFSDG
jgi:hypothetical protein